LLKDFLAPNLHSKSVAELAELETELAWQMLEALMLTHSCNDNFWDAMLDPTPILQTTKPDFLTHGDDDPLKIWIHQSVMLWRDHRKFIRKNKGKLPEP
jgi:hypothetical protein